MKDNIEIKDIISLYEKAYKECQTHTEESVKSKCIEIQDTLKNCVGDDSLYDWEIGKSDSHDETPCYTLYVTTRDDAKPDNAKMFDFEINVSIDGNNIVTNCFIHMPEVSDYPTEVDFASLIEKFARYTFTLKAFKY